MEPTRNPYGAPAPDRMDDLRIKLRRRKRKLRVQAFLLTVLGVAALLGWRMLFELLHRWLFD